MKKSEPDFVWVTQCDICQGYFEDPAKVVRLKRMGNFVVVAGFGSGPADAVVHEECLRTKGQRIGNWNSSEE